MVTLQKSGLQISTVLFNELSSITDNFDLHEFNPRCKYRIKIKDGSEIVIGIVHGALAAEYISHCC